MRCVTSAKTTSTSPKSLWLVLPLLALIAAASCRDHELRFDQHGVAYGSGSRAYPYPDGSTKKVDEYSGGVVVRSQWFLPDGFLIHSVDWTRAGQHVDIYLSDAGNIRSLYVVDDMEMNGLSIKFDDCGRVSRLSRYSDGVEIEGRDIGYDVDCPTIP